MEIWGGDPCAEKSARSTSMVMMVSSLATAMAANARPYARSRTVSEKIITLLRNAARLTPSSPRGVAEPRVEANHSVTFDGALWTKVKALN